MKALITDASGFVTTEKKTTIAWLTIKNFRILSFQ